MQSFSKVIKDIKKKSENFRIEKYNNRNENSVERHNNRMERTEAKINELKDRTVEITQREQKKIDWGKSMTETL